MTALLMGQSSKLVEDLDGSGLTMELFTSLEAQCWPQNRCSLCKLHKETQFWHRFPPMAVCGLLQLLYTTKPELGSGMAKCIVCSWTRLSRPGFPQISCDHSVQGKHEQPDPTKLRDQPSRKLSGALYLAKHFLPNSYLPKAAYCYAATSSTSKAPSYCRGRRDT